MRNGFTVGALVVCGLSVVSAQANPPAAVKSTAERLTAVEGRLDFVDQWLKGVSADTGDRSAVLSCDTGNFQPVISKGSTPVFLVSCSPLVPYLEGSRLTLSIGNASSMQFEGVSGAIGHGETEVQRFGLPTQFTSTSPLMPGIWNQVPITINPAGAKDVRVIRLYDLAFTSAKGVPR
jgi:hypothetical protein